MGLVLKLWLLIAKGIEYHFGFTIGKDQFGNKIKQGHNEIIQIIEKKVSEIQYSKLSELQNYLAEIILKNGSVSLTTINKLPHFPAITPQLFRQLVFKSSIQGFFVSDSKLFISDNFVEKTLEDQRAIFDNISFEEAANLLNISREYIEEVLVNALKNNIIQGRLNHSKRHLTFKKGIDLERESFSPIETRISFFCQLDNEEHPSTDSAFKCKMCSRMICGDCYNQATTAGIRMCPYCEGSLIRTQ